MVNDELFQVRSHLISSLAKDYIAHGVNIRIFAANPRVDGSTASNGVSDANVCVHVHKDHAEKFASTITQDYPDTLVG